ncbi:MAG: hypothetical protein SPK26_16080, partial [Treponema sp.]|nr:hypothetical protein [Treponema sp.]
NARPHSHAPATNVCFGIYRSKCSVDAETKGAALRSRAKIVQWTIFSETPSGCDAKVQHDNTF